MAYASSSLCIMGVGYTYSLMCLVDKDGKAVQCFRKEAVIRRISWSGVKEDIRWYEGGHQMVSRGTWNGMKKDIRWCEGGHDMVWRRTSDGVKDIWWCKGHQMVWRRTWDCVKDIWWCEEGHQMVWRKTSDDVKDIRWCEGGHEIVWRGRCTQWTWECHDESRLTAKQDWFQSNALSLLNQWPSY